jgi:hypothetical protein
MKVLEVLSKVLAGLVLMLAPIHPVIISVGILIFADVVFGVWAAIKKGERISSKRLGHTIGKLFVYQGMIITGFFVETYLIGGSVPIVKMCAGFIGMVEFKSLLENASAILGRDLFKDVIDKLGSKSDKNPDDAKAP